MKKLFVFFICLLAINGLMAQKRVFDTISFIRGGRVYKLKLYLDRITINDTTCYSFPGFGTSHTTCAYGDHNHSGVYEPSITKSIGFLKWSGSAWFFDPSVYSPVSHNHDGMYEPVIHYGRDGQYWDGNKTWRELNAGAVGLGNVSNIAQVTSVTGTAPVFSTGGTTPDISMPQATTSQSGYLFYLDWQTFNNKVSSQWTPNGFDLYYMKGKVGIGLTNPAYTSDVYGTANVYDYKSAENYVTKMNVKQGNASLSGIWSSATDSVPSKMPTKDVSEEKASGYIYNTSFIANPFLGAYMYFYSRDYNYQVGLFDRMGHKKAFCGIMGGGMPTQPYVNLGSAGYPWGKGYYADSIFAQKITSTGISTSTINTSGNIGIGTTTLTNVINFDGTASRKIAINSNTTAAVAGSALTLEAGSTLAGNTNKPGGDVIINGGTSTGNKTSNFIVNLPTQGSSGTNTNSLSEVLRLAGTGNLNIQSNFIYNPQVVVTGANDAAGSAAYMNFQRARGTIAAPTNCAPWDAIGTFIFRPRIRGAYTNTAMFSAQLVDTAGIYASTYMGFSTTNKNGTSNQFYFDHNGYFGISPTSGSFPTTFLDIVGDKIRLRNSKTPSSCTAAGNTGDICWDDKYVYVCVATNIWRRSATSTW